jgi:hypothetical protein
LGKGKDHAKIQVMGKHNMVIIPRPRHQLNIGAS